MAQFAKGHSSSLFMRRVAVQVRYDHSVDKMQKRGLFLDDHSETDRRSQAQGIGGELMEIRRNSPTRFVHDRKFVRIILRNGDRDVVAIRHIWVVFAYSSESKRPLENYGAVTAWFHA